MNIRVVYFVSAFLCIFIFIGILLLVKYTQTNEADNELITQELNIEQKKDIKARGWIQKVADLKKSDEVLPVNFMYLEINDNYPKAKNQPKKRYELLIPNCSDYSIFCLKRLAKSMNIELSIAKLGNKHNVYILAQDDLTAQNFVKSLKSYNITSKIKEIK